MDLNHTILVLIPKVPSLISINQFLPISLCFVLYKVITKIIVNRLKPYLDRLVAPTQYRFILEQLITYNIVVVQEVIHSMCKKKGKTAFSVIKVNLEKAHDRLCWDFIQAMLCDIGIPPELVSLIMKCVSSIIMHVNWNEHLLKAFSSSRGSGKDIPYLPTFSCSVWRD